MDDVLGHDPFVLGVPALDGGVAEGDVCDVVEGVVFALPVPDLAAGVAGVGKDGADGALAPSASVTVAVAARVVGGGAGDTVAGEALGDGEDAQAAEELGEDPLHDRGGIGVRFKAAQAFAVGGFGGVGVRAWCTGGPCRPRPRTPAGAPWDRVSASRAPPGARSRRRHRRAAPFRRRLCPHAARSGRRRRLSRPDHGCRHPVTGLPIRVHSARRFPLSTGPVTGRWQRGRPGHAAARSADGRLELLDGYGVTYSSSATSARPNSVVRSRYARRMRCVSHAPAALESSQDGRRCRIRCRSANNQQSSPPHR